MNTIVAETGTIRMPVLISTLEAFRAWMHSDCVPEETRACFLDGEVWIDMSKEQFFSHNQVKNELNIVLGGLIKSQGIGRYVPDGMLISNVPANLSAQPDGGFISYESLRNGKVAFVEGAKEGVVELEGAPDLVIEVGSNSSIQKDKTKLPDLYFRAGIAEYWLIDARGEALNFQIFERGVNQFLTVPEREGWSYSKLFGREFCLTRQADAVGRPEYSLNLREC